ASGGKAQSRRPTVGEQRSLPVPQGSVRHRAKLIGPRRIRDYGLRVSAGDSPPGSGGGSKVLAADRHGGGLAEGAGDGSFAGGGERQMKIRNPGRQEKSKMGFFLPSCSPYTTLVPTLRAILNFRFVSGFEIRLSGFAISL